MRVTMPQAREPQIRRWAALWTLVLGFFMILVDSTIVSVANPTIMAQLDTTMTATLWATSAFLLAYAVPLLITGRLGDRFGPRRLYLTGLAVFTLSSLACGLSPNIETLIAARAIQGLGASMMTPQTMAIITRIFAPNERGQAMAIWGVTAGVATLTGPMLGGLLLGVFGWEWIFFINVPVGVMAFVLSYRFVPRLERSARSFDWLGVVLSAIGMFLLVFGVQEGESFGWGYIWEPITVPGVIVAGLVTLACFALWQWWQQRPARVGGGDSAAVTGGSGDAAGGIGAPLIPLQIFESRNFTVGTLVIVLLGASMVSQALPLMFYLQLVQGLTPMQSALMLVPMAITSVLLARPLGKFIDRHDPRRLPVIGLCAVASSLLLYALMARPDISVLWLLIPSAISGVGQAFVWGPLATLTTYQLSPRLAGAGSGVYNTGRQVGAVLGSAAMAAVMQARITVHLGAASGGEIVAHGVGTLPEAMRAPFAMAMAESVLLPMATLLLGAVVAAFFQAREARAQRGSRGSAVGAAEA